MSNLLIKYAKKETEIPRFLKQSKLFSYNFIEKRQIKFQASFVDKDKLLKKIPKLGLRLVKIIPPVACFVRP